MSRTAELRERRRALYEEARSTLDEAEKECRDLAGEELARWDAQMAEVDRLKAEIDARERDERTRAEMEGNITEPKINGRATPPPLNAEGVTPYEVAFRQWVRHGRDGIDTVQRRALMSGLSNFNPDSPEQRALGVGTGAAGGYTVPQGFLRDLITRMKAYGAVRRVARVINTDTGADTPIPTFDDTSNVGRILAENTQLTATDVAFGTKTIKAYMYSSDLVLVSYQLMQDSAFDVQSELTDALGARLGRITNQHFTTGTGTGQPQGLVTGGTVGVTGATGTTLAYGTSTADAYANLIGLIHSVDPAYRQSGNCRWMIPDTGLAVIRKLADSTGQPLWQPSLQNGVPDNLLGYPVEVNPDMASPAANAKSAAFGDFNAGYYIRIVKDVQMVRLDERYADFLQVGFFAFMRADGLVRDANAYRLFQHSAT